MEPNLAAGISNYYTNVKLILSNLRIMAITSKRPWRPCRQRHRNGFSAGEDERAGRCFSGASCRRIHTEKANRPLASLQVSFRHVDCSARTGSSGRSERPSVDAGNHSERGGAATGDVYRILMETQRGNYVPAVGVEIFLIGAKTHIAEPVVAEAVSAVPKILFAAERAVGVDGENHDKSSAAVWAIRHTGKDCIFAIRSYIHSPGRIRAFEFIRAMLG